MVKLASRISTIKPSATLAITAKANALRAQGRDVVGFGAGEPDFDTPANIKAAAVKALEAGFTKYTAVGGIDELKDAIIGKFRRDSGLEYKRSQVAVSCGAKHTLYNLAQVLFEEGDEVIIPSPYWVSYPDIVILTGAKPVIVTTREEDGFKMSPAQLEGALTARTKAVVINSPSNPAGVTYSREELKALADVLARRDVLVISDDIYEKILYDGLTFHTMASTDPAMKDRTVTVNGVSKAYAMTGWRIGYAAGPDVVIKALTKLQSQNTSNPTSIAQKAAVEALNGSQESVARMGAEFQKRRDVIVAGLDSIPGIRCMKPQGAFYVFPNVSALYGKRFGGKVLEGSTSFAAFLLDAVDVAVVPGVEFGHDANIRLSYATSMKNIEEGIKRIRRAVEKLG
ncbi:MAG: Aspartate aminotransferase [Syntrophaceae bacterium PtaU1.Bin231]|nr:MAG: Aspartate aminotransferase [Syntrophaceae bacterium PtaU1.Bin231]HOG17748.1 pyridoxal phosphate-dependent aminotransferase [Syntrophales bacterium]